MTRTISTTRHAVGQFLAAVATAAVVAACAPDAPLAPGAASAASAARGAVAFVAPRATDVERTASLAVCDNLNAPAGAQLSAHAYATGVQIYRWDGTAWAFVAPAADLFTDAALTDRLGVHFAGPTWRSTSGSKVIGAVVDRCTPDANAIPWLSLRAVAADGPGVFWRTTFIQRVRTVGGLAPATRGRTVGQEARVPYTAEYYFYRGS
ncbi:MAG: DUF3455 domain-containing protein [Gemmatirosa sp.]|nr:DUF3455 domain-containing protein [Gemmatirosa sp.]